MNFEVLESGSEPRELLEANLFRTAIQEFFTPSLQKYAFHDHGYGSEKD